MTDIAGVRGTNGYKVVSTFSGCGGTCLGFEMSGFDVVFASEFVPEARETYVANHPGVHVDPRDIRNVSGLSIVEQTGIPVGQLDVLEGSPPCASFSLAGKREDGWGKVSNYSGTEQQTDDLFFEFARLVRELQPKVFVAENVKGLVIGKARGYFKEILRTLKGAGYRVEARLLDASWLGVPQARQRVIFVGVREDLGLDPAFPTPMPYRYSLGDVLDPPSAAPYLDPETGQDVGIDRYAIGPEWHKLAQGESSDRYFQLVKPRVDDPSPTITATAGGIGAAGSTHPTEPRKYTLRELRRICGFPDDFVLTGTFQHRWERLGRSVPPVMAAAIASVIRDDILNHIGD